MSPEEMEAEMARADREIEKIKAKKKKS